MSHRLHHSAEQARLLAKARKSTEARERRKHAPVSRTKVFKEYQSGRGCYGDFVWWAELPPGWRFSSGAHIQSEATKRDVLETIRTETEPCDCAECAAGGGQVSAAVKSQCGVGLSGAKQWAKGLHWERPIYVVQTAPVLFWQNARRFRDHSKAYDFVAASKVPARMVRIWVGLTVVVYVNDAGYASQRPLLGRESP